MADVELLPLPEWQGDFMTESEFEEAATAYARACVEANLAPLQAENERLRAELDRAIAELAGPEPTDGSAYYWACRVNGARRKAEARAGRLAEALRPLAALDLRPDRFDQRSDDQPVYARDNTVITVGDVRRARAALAQEDRNG